MNLPAHVREALRPSPRPARAPAPVGLYLGWGTNGPVRARPDEHALVIGPPRSGKTSRLLAFAVLSHSGPVVVDFHQTRRRCFDGTGPGDAGAVMAVGPERGNPCAGRRRGAEMVPRGRLRDSGTRPWPGRTLFPPPLGPITVLTTRTGSSGRRLCWRPCSTPPPSVAATWPSSSHGCIAGSLSCLCRP